MQRATGEVLERLQDRSSRETPFTMKDLAEHIDKTPTALRNKITGFRSFTVEELYQLAQYLNMPAAAKSLKAYIDLVNSLVPIIEHLPLTPRTICEKSGMSQHEFYRKLKGESSFTTEEIVQFAETLEYYRDLLTMFIQNPFKALLNQSTQSPSSSLSAL